MSNKWNNYDSASKMVEKYNNIADNVKTIEEGNITNSETLKRLERELGRKAEKLNKSDLGLDLVDNTPDKYKPLSEPQKQALNNLDRVKSEPVGDIDLYGDEPSILSEIYVSGNSIILNSNMPKVSKKTIINVVDKSLVFLTV